MGKMINWKLLQKTIKKKKKKKKNANWEKIFTIHISNKNLVSRMDVEHNLIIKK